MTSNHHQLPGFFFQTYFRITLYFSSQFFFNLLYELTTLFWNS
jgi:hypothetical protein